MNYRKLWESNFGSIPTDEFGRTYEIHHKDGNNENNNLDNLMCVSIQEHYDIHFKQGDYFACMLMSERMSLSQEDIKILTKLAMSKRDQTGEKNPMWGKSTSETVKKCWDNRDEQYRENFGKKVSETRKKLGSASGSKNPMYGRSAVTERKLRWYNNGENSVYISEGTQQEGYVPGRGKIKWKLQKERGALYANV